MEHLHRQSSFNAQIEFTMHEIKCFMMPMLKSWWQQKKLSTPKARQRDEIEATNIDTDGRDFPLFGVSSFCFVFFISLDASLRFSLTVFILHTQRYPESYIAKKRNHFGFDQYLRSYLGIHSLHLFLPVLIAAHLRWDFAKPGSIWMSSVSLFDISNNNFWHTLSDFRRDEKKEPKDGK